LDIAKNGSLSAVHAGDIVSELLSLVDQAYELAKTGDWGRLQSEWEDFPIFGRRCSRYVKKSSGWTFLHQAAYFGEEQACRSLIGFGADIGALSLKGKTAADVSANKGHAVVADLLRSAIQERDSLWAPSIDPDLRPSSNRWKEAKERQAVEPMLVAYAKGIVRIPGGSRIYVDSFERVLVGWHGTFSPPCGMDGESML
jgi:hypothetical protein